MVCGVWFGGLCLRRLFGFAGLLIAWLVFGLVCVRGVRVYCAFDVGLVLICGYLVVGLVMDAFRLMFSVLA